MGNVLDFMQTGILGRGEGIIPAQLPARYKTIPLHVERTEEKLYHLGGAKDAEMKLFFSLAFDPPHRPADRKKGKKISPL